MKHLPLLLIAAAACSGPGGETSDGQNLRPDGDNDQDLDGVKNDVDNCPTVTNQTQGNEDGDTFGDACDPCPIVSDDNPADGDGDGVANACDPVPNFFGDKIAFFEGFHMGVPQGWDQAGTWTQSNDQLVGSTSGAGHFALIVTDRTRETVTAKVTITALDGADSEVGVLDNRAQGGATAVACVLTGSSTIAVYSTADRAGAAENSYTVAVGQTYIIKLRRDNSTYTCTADNAGSVGMAQKTISLSNTPYLSGLMLDGAGMRLDWLLIVQSL